MGATKKNKPAKSGKNKPVRNTEIDVESGNVYRQLAGDSDKDGFAEVQFFENDDVWYADFGDDLQKGRVTKSGKQRAHISHAYDQTAREQRPCVRPNDWDSEGAAAGAAGFHWDIVTKKEPDKQKPFWNGARHVFAASVIICLILSWGVLALGENVIRLVGILGNSNDSLAAFDLAKLGNDTISVVLSLLVFLLWSTLCFKFVHVRVFWSWKPRLLNQSMMPGGFIPRPAAVSLGLLMFVTTVFISEREVRGGQLFTKLHDDSYQSHIAHGELCRADVREETHFQDDWFSRLDRLAPLGCYFGPCPENSADPGCRKAGRSSLPLVFETPFNASHKPFPNFNNPFLRTSHITVSIYHSLQGLLPAVFGREHLDESLAIDTDHTCIYQCVKWKAYGFNTLVTKVGTIGAGNAIVTKMTETITGYLGNKVTPDTTAEQLRYLLWSTQPNKDARLYKLFHKSAFFPALIFSGLRLFLAFFVYKIDDHGFFTVDYYVSQVLLFAISTSIICRKYNTFRWEKYIYSDKMWSNGSEDFVIPDGVDGDALGSKPKSVDLFVWFHMSFEERAYLLIMYARKLPTNPKKWVNKKVQCFIEHSARVSFHGQDNVKESHSMRIKRGLHNDAWPKGTVAGQEGGMALVTWDKEHILVDPTERDGQWFQTLQNYVKVTKQPELWEDKDPKLEQYKAATTTKMHPMYLFDYGEEDGGDDWDKLLKDFIGSSQCQDQVRGKILRRLRVDEELTTNKKAPTVKEMKQLAKLAEETKKKQEEHYQNHHKATN